MISFWVGGNKPCIGGGAVEQSSGYYSFDSDGFDQITRIG